VDEKLADEFMRTQTIPVMLDPEGGPAKRNFIHVDDLVSALLLTLDNPKARQQLFNISMDEPIDYGEMVEFLLSNRGLSSVKIKTEYRSTWLDNTKAKMLLGWRPTYDMRKIIESARDYRREIIDPRKIWYPGYTLIVHEQPSRIHPGILYGVKW
jgi:UDP-glucose 4-epimerase